MTRGGDSKAEGEGGGRSLYAVCLASCRRRLGCSHISAQPSGLVAWLASCPHHGRWCLTSPWSSLNMVPEKSFPGASSPPAGGILFAQGKWLSLIKHITEGASLRVALEFSGSGSGFLLTQARHGDLSSAEAPEPDSQWMTSPPIVGKSLFPLEARRWWGNISKCGVRVCLMTAQVKDTRVSSVYNWPQRPLWVSHLLSPTAAQKRGLWAAQAASQLTDKYNGHAERVTMSSDWEKVRGENISRHGSALRASSGDATAMGLRGHRKSRDAVFALLCGKGRKTDTKMLEAVLCLPGSLGL